MSTSNDRSDPMLARNLPALSAIKSARCPSLGFPSRIASNA